VNTGSFVRIRFLIAGALIDVLILLASNECLSASGKPQIYDVEVVYHDCVGSDVRSRLEIWKDENGNTVYIETRDCDGNTATAGDKQTTVDPTDYDEEARIRTDRLELDFLFDSAGTERIAETELNK
jgi:hypothetical protein